MWAFSVSSGGTLTKSVWGIMNQQLRTYSSLQNVLYVFDWSSLSALKLLSSDKQGYCQEC